MPKPTLGNLKKRPLGRTYLGQWREYRNFGQDDAAEKIGIDRSTLGRIERGKSPYGQRFLEAAAEVYACTPADLLIRDPRDPDGIWTIWDRASQNERRQIVEIAKTLLNTSTANIAPRRGRYP